MVSFLSFPMTDFCARQTPTVYTVGSVLRVQCKNYAANIHNCVYLMSLYTVKYIDWFNYRLTR